MAQESFTFAEAPSGTDAPVEESTQQDRPEGLPEKFNSIEEMAKSYHELESKLGASSSEEEETPATEGEANQEAVENIIGVDAFEKYSTEYMDNEGKLSEESYKELQEKYNFSPELVESFIKGQEALTSIDLDDVYGSIGGEEQYKGLMEWAGENLPENEVEAYNHTVHNADIGTIKLTLQGLHARYTNAGGSAPSLVTGTGRGSVGGYESKAQMIADMAKPEYKTDAAFRDKVERKLAATPDGIL
tara:strand:- start:73 stop:810 length:738 start_codon:yes stop_codon:yes gene_type:complete